MRIRRALGDRLVAKDDIGRLFHHELGALDVIREVGLEEGEMLESLSSQPGLGARRQHLALQGAVERRKDLKSMRVVGSAASTGAGLGRGEFLVRARTKNGADHGIERLELGGELERPGKFPRQVAQAVYFG